MNYEYAKVLIVSFGLLILQISQYMNDVRMQTYLSHMLQEDEQSRLTPNNAELLTFKYC